MTNLRRTSTMLAPVAAAAALAVAMAPGAGATSPVATSSASTLTSFHGTVTSVSTANRTFRIRRSGGTSLTFRVTSATVYERLSGGLSSLRGKAIEVKGRKSDGRWTARKIEPDADHDAGDDNGGGGGSDDGPNHDAGDDHGSGGHGSDD